MNKYCRICWNTLNWRMPSGEARSLEWPNSYVADHGFGHEEWLFNFEWLLCGYNPDDLNKYRYGFLQPIAKYRSRYIGETFSILVYTVDSSQRRLAVATIKNAYIPYLEELSWALARIQYNGWLDSMRQQIVDLGESNKPLINPDPLNIINVRFRWEDVEFHHPMIPLQPPHVTTRINRYVAYDWDDGFQPTITSPRTGMIPIFDDEDDAPDRSVAPRTRSAQPSITYDPQHSMLQNLLREALRKLYGETAVKMERDSVDLRYTDSGKVIFIEIKMEKTVKKCVRLALGQLLEYAHYPNLEKADVLLTVSDATPDEDDKLYLQHLRDMYRIPIYYSQWDRVNGELKSKI
jgi:hypothetical protein